jgi:lipopolysaccharide heptosyltransferase I
MLTAQRILIIKPSSLGDVVHALPVLAALRRASADAQIAWLVNDGLAPLLEGHPLLDEVIRFDRVRYGRMWRSPRVFFDFWRLVAQLRRRRFDLVIDLQGLIRSGMLCRFSGAEQRVGFAEAREGAWLFYSRRVRGPDPGAHAVDRNLAVVRALGLSVDRPEFPLGLRAAERVAAAELLARAAGERVASFTAVVPGARWETKLWPVEKIAELIDRLHAEGLARCVLLGARDERAFAERIGAACRSGVIDLVGRTSLRQLAALLDLAERVVCHDSGPLHIAAALGKPTVALFGPTNPERTGPYSDAARVVTHPVACAPCYRRACPYEHQDCLRRLEVETVLAEVRGLGREAAPRDDVTARSS